MIRKTLTSLFALVGCAAAAPTDGIKASIDIAVL